MKFQVYHANKLAFIPQVPRTFPGRQFTLVAEIHAASLGEVYDITNTVDQSWWTHPSVRLVKKSRSTSMGDVVVDEAGQRYLCDFGGWRKF